ncbi:MAG: hydroxyacid dehydrogenase [Alphaproteobacteria bacterium]
MANKAKLLVIGQLHETGYTMLAGRDDVDVTRLDSPSREAVATEIVDADAVAIRTFPLDRGLIERAEKLRIVSRHGVGFDNIDVASLNERGIPLTVVGNVNAVTVAEHTLYLMLTLAKRGFAYDKAMRDGDWGFRDSFAATELAGKTVLICGFGRIGRGVAKRCAAFDMRVAICDPMVADTVVHADGYTYVEALSEALPHADFVTLHLPMTAETEGMIDAAALALMKPTAMLLNTARGGLVDEAALVEALTLGRIGGAGLDVFQAEPPLPGNPLLAMPNVVLSPHVAGLTVECAMRMAQVTMRNVLDLLDDKLDRDLVVNRDVL